MARLLLLHLPLAFLAVGLALFISFHAWPLSAVGALFGGQPGYVAGYAGQALLFALPLWYVVGYALASLVASGRVWLPAVFGVVVAVFFVGTTFLGLLADGFSGRSGDGGLGLLPFRALSAVAEPLTAPFRKRHYLARLGDPDPMTRDLAASGLSLDADADRGKGDTGFQVGVARALRGASPDVRSSLLLALQRSYPLADRAVRELVSRLQDDTDEGRVQVADLLGTLAFYGQADAALREGLLRAAEGDPAKAVRRAAAAAAARTDPADPSLLAILDRRAIAGDAFAGAVLAKVPAWEQRAAEHFVIHLAAPHAPTRAEWTGAILGLELPAHLLEPLAELLRALGDPAPEVRLAAAQVLREERRAEPPVRLALARALRDRDPEVRWTAGWALTEATEEGTAELQPPQVVDALREGLRDPRVVSAAVAFFEKGPRSRAVTLAAIAALREADQESAWTLQRLLGGCALDLQMRRELAALVATGRHEAASSALELVAREPPVDAEIQLSLARAIVSRGDAMEGWRAAEILSKGDLPLSPAARAALQKAAANPGSEVARNARRALGQED